MWHALKDGTGDRVVHKHEKGAQNGLGKGNENAAPSFFLSGSALRAYK